MCICLVSALAHHDLTYAIPDALDVAIPRGSRSPASTGTIARHQFDRATFDIGWDYTPIPGTDQTIGMYSPERSITDAFRLRGEVGYEPAQEALKEWLRRDGKPARLMEIASRLPRAKSPVLRPWKHCHELEMRYSGASSPPQAEWRAADQSVIFGQPPSPGGAS